MLLDQIQKARERAQGIDLVGLAQSQRGKPPAEVAAPEEIEARRRFLREDLGNAQESKLAFERIVEGNELQPINYLRLGELASRSVCRIKLFDANNWHIGWATGFLIAPQVLLTNNHVFPSAAMAGRATAQFDVELDVFGIDKPMVEFRLKPDELFFTTAALDFAVTAVAPLSEGGKPLSDYGFLPRIATKGKVMEGEWLTITQHPGGERKQICVRENRLLTRTDDALWYSTDTLGGSSGSPVFNNSWQVVALHHKGIPEEKNGRMQTVDGRDFDPGRDDESVIKWKANEGIRVSRIVETLAAERPGHPLLTAVFDMTPAAAHAVIAALVGGDTAEGFRDLDPDPPAAFPRRIPEMSRSVTVTLDIADDGRVSVRGGASVAEAAWQEATAAKPGKKATAPDVDAPFDFNYANRKGYDEDFLGGGYAVHAPSAGASLASIAAPLLTAPAASKTADDYTLKYTNYSVMMNKARRLAMWTAANVDGGNRFRIGRTSDTWRYDPRILREHQLGEFYYKNNQFDRGHLTRREDMEYGPTLVAAVTAADDTCHFSNCTPQHAKFNELSYLWQNLEQHILERAIKAKGFGAQVMTGPILAEDDPVWAKFPDVQYPLRFWKIAVAVNALGKLFAAGFILDQGPAVSRFGIEAVGDVPFGAFETYQVPIAQIEQETGLTFSFTTGKAKLALSEVDPLAKPEGRTAARRRTRLRTSESTGGSFAPPDYVPLVDGASIIF